MDFSHSSNLFDILTMPNVKPPRASARGFPRCLYLRLSCHQEPALKGLPGNWKTKDVPHSKRTSPPRSSSYRLHAVNQFAYFNSCYAACNIRHAIGDDEVVMMENRAAGIDDIGDIPLALFLAWGK